MAYDLAILDMAVIIVDAKMRFVPDTKAEEHLLEYRPWHAS